jgi:hypothetical protein
MRAALDVDVGDWHTHTGISKIEPIARLTRRETPIGWVLVTSPRCGF